MQKIIIFGTGLIAELAHYYFSVDSNYQVVAFTVDKKYIKDDFFCNKPVIPFENIIENYPSEKYKMFIALSYSNMNKVREAKYKEAKQKGYELVSYISSKATVFDNVRIGDNCFILENTIIQPFVKIGSNVTLWSGSIICHNSKILDNVFVGAGAIISGNVTVSENVFIGLNSSIRNNIQISKECIIAMGAIINKSTKENGVYIMDVTKLIKKNSLDINL